MIEIGTTVEIIEKPSYLDQISIGDIGIIKDIKYKDFVVKFNDDSVLHIPRGCITEYRFKSGDRIKVINGNSKYCGCLGTVYSYDSVYNKVNFFIDNTRYQPDIYKNNYYTLKSTSVNLIHHEREEEKMNKLTGYNKVAVIKLGGVDYYYALYDDYEVGDTVLVSGVYEKVVVINEILALEEAKIRCNKIITVEVKCRVDLSVYNQRVENRIKAAELRKAMDKKIEEMDEMNKYTMYAERNPELAKMLAEYNTLV